MASGRYAVIRRLFGGPHFQTVGDSWMSGCVGLTDVDLTGLTQLSRVGSRWLFKGLAVFLVHPFDQRYAFKRHAHLRLVRALARGRIRAYHTTTLTAGVGRPVVHRGLSVLRDAADVILPGTPGRPCVAPTETAVFSKLCVGP